MTERWTAARANEWYAGIEPIVGCNYLPRTAVNSTEMWQATDFDATTIDEELGWAAAIGYNSLRVFVQYLVWQSDPDGLLARMERFLGIAASHGMTATFILFDDCAFAGKEPFLGPQDEPVPHTHNSGWTPSPGLTRVEDRAAWPDLERYIRAVVGAFGADRRVLCWDLYNEPGNSGMDGRSAPLVAAAFDWARAEKPQQPLTTSVWRANREAQYDDEISQLLFTQSDVISFHHYHVEGLEDVLARCSARGRPLLCTECLHRPFGQTLEVILPLFARARVGWYNWGLVAGRTQTWLDWRREKNDIPGWPWQHDIFHADGRPYDPAEVELIRNFAFG